MLLLIKELEIFGISIETFNLVLARYRDENINENTLTVMFYTSQFQKYETKVLSCMALKLIYFIILLALSGFSAFVSAFIIMSFF